MSKLENKLVNSLSRDQYDIDNEYDIDPLNDIYKKSNYIYTIMKNEIHNKGFAKQGNLVHRIKTSETTSHWGKSYCNITLNHAIQTTWDDWNSNCCKECFRSGVHPMIEVKDIGL